MINSSTNKAVLLMEDGTFIEGNAIGKIGTTTGEICFNTGMTGYQEIFTDPSYFGQMLIATNVHIGNYGISKADVESEKIQIAGLICRDFNIEYSRPMADEDIQGYFEKEGLVGISNVDTRELVKKVRDKGAMNVIISSEEFTKEALQIQLNKVPSMAGLELASKVCTGENYFMGDPSAELRIAVLDFGTKKNILQCFVDRGCYLQVFPAKSSYAEVMKWEPDGIFLSNGPGDPASMDYAIDNIKKMLEINIPLFGICLGHQLLALANDIPTYKMHHGHRGINHPVKNMITGKCEITSQNHGFGVRADMIKEAEDRIEVSHVNLNDDTVEGISIKDRNAFSVQYHPESSPGPHDSRYLFDDFINLIKKVKTV